ncbi:hypothetical protein MRS44_013224 [Fusarium solani]|uniref:uncharacterized protein n=1 Tax=Fusarium solani TaxID=169388 RepID=UPI0032C48E5D|nr:hypothetical protein MRS44_013224 [Fusarium solani]
MPRYEDWLAASEPERMALSHRLLRQNPHIAAFHFYRRYCLFRDIVLSKKFNITDYWDRYEWQGRGSPHNHGLYWMDNCPGTDMDDEAARDVFARTWGFHVTAINPEPSRAMPQGEGNPLSVDPLSIEMTFLRLSQIVNRCQRHKCNTTYCLRVRKRTGDLARDMEGAAADIEAANVANPERECRFDFPRALRELAAVIRKEGMSYYVFEAARNDSLMNHFNPAIILGWLANIDISPCTSLQAVITYAAKYCSKSEKKTEPYCKLADQVLPHTAHLQPLLSFSSRLMNKLIAERDYSAQEISHLLLNIPLQEGTRMVVTVDCRPLERQARSYRVDGDVNEAIGSYRKYLERKDQHEDITYLEYLQSYNLNTWRRLAAQAKKRVLSYFPRYKSMEASSQFNDFCRVKLMMVHPHRSPEELLVVGGHKGVLNSTSPPWFSFPIGSVPTRSMIAFLRDLDPAGRSEPEGMESTAPSTNDVDVLSSATLAVASLATPAPSLREETPHEEVEHQYLWRCFPDYVWSQRVRDTPSWVWGFGYDVEDSSGSRRWVCRRCIQNKNPKPRSFAEKGIQNANAHLFKGHGIRAPPDKTKSAAEKKAEKLKAKDQRSIAEVMKLDTRLPREQDIANSLAKGFDRKHLQRLLLEWIIEENHAFSVCEQGRLRQIFEYLNPLVKITDANITRTTIRRKVLSAYEMHKDKVIAALKQSCGLIHVSFDGWKSGNRHSMYGIACFFRDENSQPRKLTLGVPELRTRHFGHNIAAEILDVLDAYGIQDKIGYFTLDNAESNDKAMEIIGGELRFVGSTRRGRCFGHTLNLSAKALLFGHNVEAFEEQLSGEAALSEAEHTLWRRKGPVGKLHNLVVDVRRSDQLTYLLRSIQRSEFDLSSDPRIRARQPVDLVIDNDTRWLSQLYMIRRAIILRPFIEQLVLKHRQQWEQDNRSKRTGNLRKSAREPRICLEENQLTVNDWAVLEHLAKLLGFYQRS